MAKISRKTQKIFGSGAGGTGITKFGSVAAGAVAYSTDIAEIQNTTAWTNGWLAAVLSGAKLKPVYQDVNAVDYTFSQQLANIFQDGIPVFDIGTEYHIGCVCRKDTTTELYKSLVDANSGNLLTDATKWGFLCDLSSINADKLDGYHALEIVEMAKTVSHPVYCANSGNVNVDGYADIVANIEDSETSVSFKVGSPYANLGITFPNGKHYEISSIADVTGLDDDKTYNFVIYEENLTALGGGLYSAVVTAVKLRYTEEDLVSPTMVSNASGVWTITASSTASGYDAYKASDNNLTTYYSADIGDTSGYWQIAKDLGTFSCTRIEIKVRNNATAPNNFAFKDELGNVLLSVPSETWTTGEIKSYNVTGSDISALKIDVTSTQGSVPTEFYEIKIYNSVTYAGGNITEGYTYPESPTAGDLHLSINQNPMLPILYTADDEYISKQFVKIGEVTKATTLGTPISYAFNGGYDSGWFAVATSSNYTKIHNIGSVATPSFFYSLDSAGVDSQIALTLQVSGANYGHYNRPAGSQNNKLVTSIGFEGGTQYYNNSAKTSGYYKVITKRSF